MKKFIMCVVMIGMCSAANASISSSDRYEIVHKYKAKKSIKKIIRELLNRKKPVDVNNTTPITFYDAIEPNKLENLA